MYPRINTEAVEDICLSVNIKLASCEAVAHPALASVREEGSQEAEAKEHRIGVDDRDAAMGSPCQACAHNNLPHMHALLKVSHTLELTLAAKLD